jgi:uridine kinase
VLLIDGRSGSGKTELARAIVADYPRAQLVRLDDLYPGWGGLEAGSQTVHDEILRAEYPRWRRWDWITGRHAEWNSLDRDRPLVIEGCGALSRQNRSLASFGIWVALDPALRKSRALARDGESYEPHWNEWAAQEDVFLTRENPAAHADAIVDGHDVTVGLERWREVLEP